MTQIHVTRVDEDLRNTFKAYCAAKGTTMRDELIRYMQSVTERELAKVYGERLAKSHPKR